MSVIEFNRRKIDWHQLKKNVRKNRRFWQRRAFPYRLIDFVKGENVFVRKQQKQQVEEEISNGSKPTSIATHTLTATFQRRGSAASLSYEYVDYSSLENQKVTFANADLLGSPPEALEQGQQPVEITIETWKGFGQAWRRSVLTQRFFFTGRGERIGRGNSITTTIESLSPTAYIPEIGLQPTQEIDPARSVDKMINQFGTDSPINLLQKTKRRGR